ncbi:MAG: V-type ATP synthase subunit E family protein [Sphaerochaetaceae bacterium]|jgi:vacuolar-type H+-ATPase subunit E/Vma4
MSQAQDHQLFDGILSSAQAEAASLIERAKRDAELISATYLKRQQDAVEQEIKRGTLRLQQLQRSHESTLKALQRKSEVSRSMRLQQLVLDTVASEMEKRIGSSEYRQMQIEWIAEAAIGLDRPSAFVYCSFKETIDQQVLTQAQQLIKKMIGKEIELKYGGAVLTAQGVEVRSTDGKVAYNNQISNRLKRMERQVNELMGQTPCRSE